MNGGVVGMDKRLERNQTKARAAAPKRRAAKKAGRSERDRGATTSKAGTSVRPDRSRTLTSPAQVKRARRRKVSAESRRQAILDAALSIFAEKGFEAARLDDVAARAGIAKGTLYLYFRDKEGLFEELIRSAVSPILEAVSTAAASPSASALTILDTFLALFKREVLGTRRKLLLRLIIAEGPRFPAIAEFYYREVVTRGLDLLRGMAERGYRDGEIPSSGPARFPQLVVAPLLLAVIWDGLFANIAPLDVGGMLRAHRELLTGRSGSSAP
jgi:AcrR family transcriptional regulator